jgi:Predicted nucleotide-binding protein containing TIR-like domain
MGYLEEEDQPTQRPVPAKNVIMEMGMLLASLTRKRCAILQKGFIELPSNMGGVITIPFNSHVREAVPKLVQRLQEAGFHLDAAAKRTRTRLILPTKEWPQPGEVGPSVARISSLGAGVEGSAGAG